MTHVDRREFLGWSALAAAGLCADGLVSPAWAQDVRGLPLTAAVQTAAGRVRGVVRFGVNQFWGVPYAASTAGANRFMPPVKAAPWSGVRDCFQVGNRSPQDPDGPISEVFALDRQEPMGEDCLNLNVFTPGTRQRQPAGDGVAARRRLLRRLRQLAAVRRHQPRAQGRRGRGLGDAPAESVRLPHLADLGGGEKWANASNAGMQDIVAALHGSRRTSPRSAAIPGNVTVFGQSGGGSKVTTLMAMPSAKGLFHRAIAMSGAQLRGATRENAHARGRAVPRQARARSRISSIGCSRCPGKQLQEAFLRRAAHSGTRRRPGRRRPVAAARSVVSRRARRVGRRAADDGIDGDRGRVERSAAAAADVRGRDADARPPHRPQRRGEGARAGRALSQDACRASATPTCG